MTRKTWTCSTLVLLGLMAATGGCGGGSNPDPAARANGQSDFQSPDPSTGNFAGGRNSAEDNAAPGTATGAPQVGGAKGVPAVQRLIEEGDIVKVSGNYLYVLNQFRGVQVVDLTNPDDPQLISRAPLYGQPLEMYVRGGNVYALVSDYYTYARCLECDGGARSFHGSTLAVIDVSNPASAILRTKAEIEGNVSDSRIVGDVMYVVSNRDAWWYAPLNSDDNKNTTYVTSFNIANPDRLVQVGTPIEFPREGWENHIHVTDKLLYVAASSYGYWDGGECSKGTMFAEPCTSITAVDISSPVGVISRGATLLTKGFVQNRWALDWWNGTLRVIMASQPWGNTLTPPRLRTFAAPDANTMTALATLDIPLQKPESLTTTRFDGPRAYAVTFERIDPLWTIDVSNPAKPFVAGHLETPGWLDFIEPRGDSFIALGHDRASDTAPWSLQVSLYDVKDLTKPRLVQRHPFGEGWGWVPGEADDYQKIFKVIDAQGLIMMPFQTWVESRIAGDWWGGSYKGGIQLFSFDLKAQTLDKQGFVEHPGYITRAVPFGKRILGVSNEAVQVVNAENRNAPVVTATLELSRNVSDIAVSGNTAIELAGDLSNRDTKLYVVPANDPDTSRPSAVFNIPAPEGRIFTNGALTYVVSQDWAHGPGETNKTRVDVIEMGATPRRRGKLVLPFQAQYWFGGYYYFGWGGVPTGVTQVGPTTLVLAFDRPRAGWGEATAGGDKVAPATGAAEPGATGGAAPIDSTIKQPTLPDADYYVIDLANPDAPAIASRITIPDAAWLTSSGAAGNVLYATHYEWVITKAGTRPAAVRYFLDRVDLTDPYHPVVSPKVSVPGAFLTAHGDEVFTYEYTWDQAKQRSVMTIYGLYLPGGVRRLTSAKAYLRSQLAIENVNGGVIADGNTGMVIVEGSLWAIDLTSAERLGTAVLSKTPIAGVRAHKQGAGSSGGGGVSVGGGVARPAVAAQVVASDAIYWDWAYLHTAASGFVFIMAESGLVIYDMRNPRAPVFNDWMRTQGWVQQIRVVPETGRAYLPSGPYGVDVVKLDKE